MYRRSKTSENRKLCLTSGSKCLDLILLDDRISPFARPPRSLSRCCSSQNVAKTRNTDVALRARTLSQQPGLIPSAQAETLSSIAPLASSKDTSDHHHHPLLYERHPENRRGLLKRSSDERDLSSDVFRWLPIRSLPLQGR
jgi:hypothetical protein